MKYSQKYYGSQFTLEHLSHKRRQSRKKLVFLFSAVAVIFSVSIFFFIRSSFSSEKEVVAPLVSYKTIPTPSVSDSRLSVVISEVVENAEGDYGVVVKQLRGDEEEYLNEDKKFWSASLYKLWVMAAVYKAVEDGRMSLDTHLTGDIADLNAQLDIASESAELIDGEVSGTVAELLHEMITISGNYPGYLLGKTVGMGNVAELMRESGWSDSNIGVPPKTTARDIADFFEKLYKGEVVSPQASTAMLGLLSQQRLNDRIPYGVSENTKVAHKTGELNGYKHDAGIVYAPFGDYVIVLLSNTSSQEQAVVVEQEISRVVWEYFEEKSNARDSI